MNFIIHQSFNIYMIRVGAITNSSVFQIGSSGSILAHSDIHNTGGYTETAQEVQAAQTNPAFIVPLEEPKQRG